MAGFCPNEGETFLATHVLKQTIDAAERGTNLQLGLFTNSSIDETITHATLTEPSGTGYARITLTDASWTVTGDTASYAQQTFTAGGTWTGNIRGYFICTNGTTKRILFIENDPGAGTTGISMVNTDTYKITPTMTFA